MKCLKLKKVAASSRRVTFCNLLGTGQLTSTTVFYNVFFFRMFALVILLNFRNSISP